ncbi:MAG: hypothetical protein VKL98_09655 [Cyanobacteriota bacterium]|nr:hypothetical protein [Cyanobacteriota bacterium]
MSESYVNIGPIACRLSNLIVSTDNGNPDFSATVLQGNQPFSLQVTVGFSGPGAIALMPLSPAIQVNFYTKPLGPETGVELGSLVIKTKPGVFNYTPTLTLGSPFSIGLKAKMLYRIGAALRVGARDWPSLITGYTEEVTVELYTDPTS